MPPLQCQQLGTSRRRHYARFAMHSNTSSAPLAARPSRRASREKSRLPPFYLRPREPHPRLYFLLLGSFFSVTHRRSERASSPIWPSHLVKLRRRPGEPWSPPPCPLCSPRSLPSHGHFLLLSLAQNRLEWPRHRRLPHPRPPPSHVVLPDTVSPSPIYSRHIVILSILSTSRQLVSLIAHRKSPEPASSPMPAKTVGAAAMTHLVSLDPIPPS